MGDLFSSKQKQKSSSTSTNTSSSNSTATQDQSSLTGQAQNTNNTSLGLTSNTSDSGPSRFQLPYLTQAFGAATDNYKTAAGTPYYTGDLYAGMGATGKADLDASRQFALTTGLGTAGALSSLGTSLTGSFGKASSTLDDYLKMVNGDSTADITAAASKYADNPYVNGQIDAVNRDVSRELNEETLPGIDRQASGTGNINSSRAGVAAGIAQRGAADRMADNAASIRSQAYNQGLTIAQAQRDSKLQGLMSAASAFTGLGGQGISAIGAGSNAGFQSLSALLAADKAEQADRQGQLDADYQKWAGNDGRASDLLQRFYSIVGNNALGSSGTTTGTNLGQEVGSTNGLQFSQGTGTTSGTQTGTATGTSKGSSTTIGSPGLGGLVAGGLSLAGGLGWSPLKPLSSLSQKGFG